MNLLEFIASESRNEWIKDCGLSYYVRKSLRYPGLIELANCSVAEDEPFGMWRFLRRYASDIPFMMEQVLNPGLAKYVRRLGWNEERLGGVPQFYSPLAMARFNIQLRLINEPDITIEFWESCK